MIVQTLHSYSEPEAKSPAWSILATREINRSLRGRYGGFA